MYSPAHIEEIYTAFVNGGSDYEENMLKLFDQISRFTNNFECLPSFKSIIIIEESPIMCYARVAHHDTTGQIKDNAKKRYEIDNNNNYQKACKQDKHNVSISTLRYDKIWEHEAIISTLGYWGGRIERNI